MKIDMQLDNLYKLLDHYANKLTDIAYAECEHGNKIEKHKLGSFCQIIQNAIKDKGYHVEIAKPTTEQIKSRGCSASIYYIDESMTFDI